MSSTAGTLEKKIVLRDVPIAIHIKAVFAEKFVAGVIEVVKTLVYSRTEKSFFIIDYRLGTLVAFFTLKINVEGNQSVLVVNNITTCDVFLR